MSTVYDTMVVMAAVTAALWVARGRPEQRHGGWKAGNARKYDLLLTISYPIMVI